MDLLDENDCSGKGNILCRSCTGLIIHGCPCPDSRVRMCQCLNPSGGIDSSGKLLARQDLNLIKVSNENYR
jgi:hypothetical protein